MFGIFFKRVHFNNRWNPAVESQAIDRVHRFGQLKPVQVHRITIQGSIEDRIIDLQKKKQEIIDAAMGDGTMTRRQRLTLSDLMSIFGVSAN
jgi:SNF2 family DNA or RNA helicase